MREDSLRTVLLIAAIEESDQQGRLIPLADREQATRNALRGAVGEEPIADEQSLTGHGEALLAARAVELSGRLLSRHSVAASALRRTRRLSRPGWLLVALALSLGLVLPTLDGSRRINVLAFPLLGLVCWNLCVYALLSARWLRRRPRQAAGAGAWMGVRDWLNRARSFAFRQASRGADKALGAALLRFLAIWQEVGARQALARARGLMHLGAAMVAVGLVVGLYVRGVVLEYEAGWESTFLGPAQVATLLTAAFGPASALSGIPLPATEEAVLAMRWRTAGGGVPAAPWIHLVALTALLYVVIPRLVLAAWSAIELRRAAACMRLPATLIAYARRALGTAGLEQSVIVRAYGYSPAPLGTAGLTILLQEFFGGPVHVESRPAIGYGEEEEARMQIELDAQSETSTQVLVMNLASTPEVENHGLVITNIRDAIAGAGRHPRLLVIVDESAYAARMTGDAGYATRLAERRRLWRDFVRARSLEPCLISLASIAERGTAGPQDLESLRAALEVGETRAHV